jgi:diguanylate cyclase (GGDEF)-like protein
VKSESKEDESIREALERLQFLIRERVDAERRRDLLTGLENELGRNQRIEQAVKEKTLAWLAFVEVDKFKSLNTRYGYDQADELLKRIADLLQTYAPSLPGTTQAFRAHGDEFYLLSTASTSLQWDVVENSLVQLAKKVSEIRIAVDTKDDMQCTVSVGWLTIDDLPAEERSIREIQGKLEQAVDLAKDREGNTCIRFLTDTKASKVNTRGRCAGPDGCGASYSFDAKPKDESEDGWCPNCGRRFKRGQVVAAPPPVIDEV